MKLRNCSLLLHVLLIGAFVVCNPLSRWPMLAAPALHFLILWFDSACSQGHCHIANTKDLMMCENCGLVRWIRMRHCNRCERCVHKYDHHCVLMGICVGEFNHKYYLLFLYVALINAIVLIQASWSNILPEVVLDEGGIEHVSFLYCSLALAMIVLSFKLILMLYLSIYHSFYAITAQTTWEYFKRSSITYLSAVSPDRKHPFSRGVMANLAQFWAADPTRPTVWTIS